MDKVASIFSKAAACLICIVVIATAGFFAGQFTARFNSNLCYSYVMASLAKASINVMQSEDIAKHERYIEFTKNLPLQGYESDCNQIKQFVENFASNEGMKPER